MSKSPILHVQNARLRSAVPYEKIGSTRVLQISPAHVGFVKEFLNILCEVAQVRGAWLPGEIFASAPWG